MGILKAILIIGACPVIGLFAGLCVSLIGHWLSGEASEPSSGQPWLMMSMLFVPVGLLVGFVSGLGMAAVSWNGWNPPFTPAEWMQFHVSGAIVLVGGVFMYWVLGLFR